VAGRHPWQELRRYRAQNRISGGLVMTRHSSLFALLIVLVGGSTASAQPSPAAEGWTPELSMRFRAVQGTAISPDGSLIAYVVREPVMEGEKSEYLSHIWIASADGTRNAQYTRGERSATNPRFSPDGQWLAFSSSRSGDNQVWAMPVAGGEAGRVTEAKTGVGAWAWSPDRSRIAYLMSDPDSEEEAAAKKEKRDVIVADADFKFSHVYVVPFQEGATEPAEATRITEGDFNVVSFDWAPDGRSIVFHRQTDPRTNTGRLDGDIMLVDIGSRQVRPLVTEGGVHASPRFSPDGATVAFTSTGMQPEPVGLGDVYVVPAAGGSPRKLADSPDRSANIAGWSRDGRDVYVVESVRTQRHLWALPVAGGEPRRLTQQEGVYGSLSLTGDGSRMAYTFETSDSPPDVYVSPVDRYAAKRLTKLHENIAMPAMGRTEVLTWKSQDGRFDIDGLLTYPVGYQPGQRVPLLLNVHGGPSGVFSETFTGGPGIYMIQVFAQKGYAVLRPNPRGSTGYGRDFRFANVKDWGFGDMDDLMAGVDQVIEMGVAHPDSLLLAGWSYGGYMTSFAVTRTDRFRAASMGAGLPNLISMTTTTDIPDYLVGHMGGEFWDDYETYERHSAMYRIANVKTPTQVIHGERDLRVPFTQGQEFYVALQRRGVPTEMIVLPRTPHGPQEPKLLMAVTPRMLDWFDKHLGRSRPVS
jgi:dipeptidyl aminopeptidase/acylaminoacyl peptidase